MKDTYSEADTTTSEDLDWFDKASHIGKLITIAGFFGMWPLFAWYGLF